MSKKEEEKKDNMTAADKKKADLAKGILPEDELVCL